MLISEISYAHGIVFDGDYRIRRPRIRIANNGNRYLSAYIEDRSGELKILLWDHLDFADCLKDLDCIAVRGRLRRFNNEWIVNILTLEKHEHFLTSPAQMIPRSLTPLPELLDQLNAVVNSLCSPALKQFTTSVLCNDNITFPFVALPASRRNHHCTGGGLLEHSLECVAMVARFEEFSKPILDLAIVGALFHDIGKIRTVPAHGKLNLPGYVLDHNTLTLEILSGQLQKLDETCPDSAIALRYLWTWQSKRDHRPIPLLTVAEAIAAADRISAGLNNEDQLFRECPDWQRFGKFDGRNTLWRPMLESSVKVYRNAAIC